MYVDLHVDNKRGREIIKAARKGKREECKHTHTHMLIDRKEREKT
jgi:hypothetical protein